MHSVLWNYVKLSGLSVNSINVTDLWKCSILEIIYEMHSMMWNCLLNLFFVPSFLDCAFILGRTDLTL